MCPLGFRAEVNRQETRLMGLSSSEDRIIVAWVVLAWYQRVTDRRSDGQTESIIAKTALCIASYADALSKKLLTCVRSPIVAESWSQNCIKQTYFSDLYQLIKRLVQHLPSSTPSPWWTQLLCSWPITRHHSLNVARLLCPTPSTALRLVINTTSAATRRSDSNYTKTEACKLYSRVFWIFLPNVIKIDPYNFELYRFKPGAFFETQITDIIKLQHYLGT